MYFYTYMYIILKYFSYSCILLKNKINNVNYQISQNYYKIELPQWY